MKIVRKARVFNAEEQNESAKAAFFDSLLKLSSGDWICGFTAGKTKHHHQASVRLARSIDNGRSWSGIPWRFASTLGEIPGSLVGAEMVEIHPGRLLIFSTWFDRSEPDRPLFDPETEGILRSKQLMAASDDGGVSWSDWRAVSTPELTGCAVTGPVQKWRDGAIAFAFESFKEFDDPAPARHAAWLLVSRDGGETFESPVLVARDPAGKKYFWDQRLCPGPIDGDYIAMFWTHDRSKARDLNVHFLWGNIAEVEPPLPAETSIPGQIAAPLLLADGRILAFVVDRSRPGTMRLWASNDRGRTWPESDSIVVHDHEERAQVSQGSENVDFAEYWEDMGKWSFGHPSVRSLDTSDVLVTWYAGAPNCMSIHAAVVNID